MKQFPPFRLIPQPLNDEAAQLPPFRWASPEIGKRHKLGGAPDFIQPPQWPTCPNCKAKMTFYGQLDSINDEFCIADGTLTDAAFVHAVLKIGAGRSEAAKRATVTGLFDIMKAHFADDYARRGLALSLEFNEFSESGTLKHNNLHALLRPT